MPQSLKFYLMLIPSPGSRVCIIGPMIWEVENIHGIVSVSRETWTVSSLEWWKASQLSSEESKDDERGVPMTECGRFWSDMIRFVQ